MNTRTLRIRPARPADASGISEVHDAAWREAYRGIIPGRELERMVMRRGPLWWRRLLSSRSRVIVLDFDDRVAGYVTYGPSRMRLLPYGGEIFELYLAPEFQGLGFGRRLFRAARHALVEEGYPATIVWALAPNERAVAFYEKLGGVAVVRRHERIDEVEIERIGFGWA
jgi:ribosomal protein S18 acetylase RimI-like enzyme